MEKSQDRLNILKKIKELEKNKQWDIDPEDDPETIELLPNKVDYLNKKLSSKIASKVSNFLGTRHFEKLIKNKQLIIKEVIGLENFLKVESGAIITCNHFNPCDNYAVYRVIKPYLKKKRLYKVIREGNFTNFPGLYGFLFRHCNTLPLSSNTQTMKKFLSAIKILLGRGEKILIYPEQAMWWNYKKPRPFKSGAFNLAVSNNVPIVPFFITMQDSETIGADGFNIQEYTIHISKPIYLQKDFSKKQNIEYMREQNYKIWVEIYEKSYNKKLTCDE